MRRALLVTLLAVNVPVWLGQVWPEGAPPFARVVSIAFLTATFAFLLAELVRASLSPRGERAGVRGKRAQNE